MIRSRLYVATFVAGSMALPLLTGCAGWKPNLKVPTAMPERKARESEAVREFERHRDNVQLQAAMDRWTQDDQAGCEARLASLVERRPDHVGARMRLGEILWSRGQAAGAETQFRAVLDREPNRAEAHHALGLLLDATGQREEALTHLLRAAELEPENEIYQQTCDSLTTAGTRKMP